MNKTVVFASTFIFVASIVLLFARLGHYALWDDEAITAMTARAVWQSGDTSVRVDDHNLLVYRNGLLVRDFKDRYTSPLQFYLIAPFIGLLGESNFACRLPIALCGVVTVGIFFAWLNKLRPSPLVWWSAAVILLTNASFFLFFRQCRYYGLATMLTALIAYLYCNRGGGKIEESRSTTEEDGGLKIENRDAAASSSILDYQSPVLKTPASTLHSPTAKFHPRSPKSELRWTAALALALSALLAAQYLDYAAVVGCLVVDYLLWGRKNPFTMRHWMIILLPQIIVGCVVLSIWNPLAQQTGNHYHSPSWINDRIHLFWWNWRDMIGCDFVILPLLVACPLLYFKRNSTWLLRAPMALFVFIGSIALAVPTSLAQAHNAEVRYLAPALVLCIGVAVVAVAGLQAFKPKAMWTVLAIALLSTVIEPVSGGDKPVLGSVALMYYHELAVPQVESYTPVIDWINNNVPAGASIYAQPGYKAYPLMFRASKALYAWQLDGDTVTFTPQTPAPDEMPTLTCNEQAISISVTNPVNPDARTVSAALIDAWNNNPNAAALAMATGDDTITLTALKPGMPLHVFPSVKLALTGMLTKTTATLQRPDFRDLPNIHFKGRVAPDYMIRFGSNSESGDFPRAIDLLATRGIHYQQIDTIHLHWRDYYRPERIWRSFVTPVPLAGDEIYIYQKIKQSGGTSVKR